MHRRQHRRSLLCTKESVYRKMLCTKEYSRKKYCLEAMNTIQEIIRQKYAAKQRALLQYIE